MQDINDQSRFLLSDALPFSAAQRFHFVLSIVEYTDVTQRLLGKRALIIGVQVVELAPRMRHATDLDHTGTEARLSRSSRHTPVFPASLRGRGEHAP